MGAYVFRQNLRGRKALTHRGKNLIKENTDIAVRDKVLRATSTDDLDSIFVTDGFFE
jgi:hypothetical protein